MELFEALVTTLPSQSSHTTLGKGDTELYTIHTIEFQIHTRYIQLLYYRYCICTINPKHNMFRDIMEWRIFGFLILIDEVKRNSNHLLYYLENSSEKWVWRSDVTWNIFIISANNGLLDWTFYGISRILDGPRLIKSKLYDCSGPFFTFPHS